MEIKLEQFSWRNYRTAALDDALAVEERPNMPGTTTQWPNWKIALPASLETIRKNNLIQKISRVFAKVGK